ncbi:uncharacterized protein [Diadema antillarum]|uniref:uncharacterized protein n=1 Tax=Diadema antillarum TaxID=105358 RepID=UPI003A83E653
MAWSLTRPFILISTNLSEVQHCVKLSCKDKETWSQKVCTLDPPEELYMACERNHELQLKCANESSHLSVGSRVIWRHNGTEVSDGGDNSGNVSVLRIPNTTWTDAGSYSCVSETNMTIRSYSVRIGIPPRGSSLECHCNDYTVLICTWTVPETNLPTNARCGYFQSNYHEDESCESSSGEYRFNLTEHRMGGTVYYIKILTRNAVGHMSDPTSGDLMFWISRDSEPYPPEQFELDVTRISPTEQQLQISWNYSLPEGNVAYSTRLQWLVDIYVNTSKEESFLGDITSKTTSTQYNLDIGNVSYCVKIMTKPTVMSSRLGTWSDQQCIAAPPNRPNVKVVVNSCESSSTEDCCCEYHPVDHSFRRSVTISWKVQPWEEDGPEPFQGVKGFNLSINRLTGNGLQYDRTILHNVTESDPNLLFNTTFRRKISDLLAEESYLLYLSAFNSAGSTDPEQVQIVPMAPTGVTCM